MKFENIKVFNFDGALRGMRNPLESWNKSDSKDCDYYWSECTDECPLKNWCNDVDDGRIKLIIGENDLKLAQRLILAGSEHSKFMRQIFVSVDITAPLFWYKEFDTYKIGTVANSTSTMHKLATTPITLDCFEIGDYSKDIDVLVGNDYFPDSQLSEHIQDLIDVLETLRWRYSKTNDKRYWKELIRWLPESWLQTRTITMSYANLRNMYFQRKTHKLTEWSVDFCNWVETLPYSKELIMLEVK